MKKLLQQFWPLLAIVALWIVFSLPFLLHGKIPFPGDYQVTFFPPWSQYSQFAMPVKNSAMPDVIDQLYPWKHLVINEWKAGQIPLWNPYNFAGTPLLANNQSAVFSPLNILFFILPFKIGWAFLILLQPLIAGFGMYWYARKIAISQLGATLASAAFMFCGFLVSWMGYGTLDYAIGILPIILVGLEGFLATKHFRYILLASAGIAFSFVSGHFQMSLYGLFASGAYYIFRYFPRKNGKTIAYGALALVSGVLLAAVQLFPSIEFYGQSLRSTIFSRPEIIPWQYFITILAPDFFGNPVTGNAWFGHYAEWNSYLGVVPLVFALFSLLLWRKNGYVRFYSLLAFVSLLLATPTIFGDMILYLHIPVLATSAAGRIIVLLSFSFAVLAGIGIDYWQESKKNSQLVLGVISLVLLLIGWSIIAGKLGLSVEHAQIAKQNFLLPTLFLLSIIAFSFLVYFVHKKQLIVLAGITLLLITFFDMYRFASKWQSFSPQSLVFPDVGVTKFFQTIENQRSFGNYGGQVSLYYQLPSVEGYDALYPERIGEFASYVADGKNQPANRSVVEFPRNGRYSTEALNLLGVSYIIQKISDMHKPWSYPVWQHPNDFQVVYQDSAYLVLKNKNVFPRAFLTNNFAIRNSKEAILNSLFASNINPRRALIVENNPGIAQNQKISSHVNITSYTFNRVTIQTQSNGQALLFLGDTYFPGWHAYVDGKETPIYRTDYTFRSVVVPAGVHTVVFSYMPISFIYGLWAASCGVVLLGYLYLFQKKRFL